MGGMLLHLQRKPATPLVAAERCTDSPTTMALLRQVAAQSSLPVSAAEQALSWMGGRGGVRSLESFTSLEDALSWEDVEPLCASTSRQHLLQQLQQGTEPFGAQHLLIFPCSCTPSHEVTTGSHLTRAPPREPLPTSLLHHACRDFAPREPRIRALQ